MEVILREVRLALPSLFEPFVPRDGLKPGQVAKYGAVFLIEPGSANEKVMKDAMGNVATALWQDKMVNIVTAMGPNQKCMRPGELKLIQGTGDVREGFAGMMQVIARNKAKPVVVDLDLSAVSPESGRVYAGCYVNAKIDVYAMKAKGEVPNGIYASLLAVQFVKAGDRFAGAGAVPSASGFESIGELPSAGQVDPFA